MPFQFQAPPDRNTSTIADLLERQGEVQAQSAIARGQASAGAVAGATNAITGTLHDAIQFKLQEPQRELTALEVQEARQKVAASDRAVRGQQVLTSLIPKYTKSDPDTGGSSIDHEGLARDLAAQGYPDAANAWLKQAADSDEAAQKLRQTQQARREAVLTAVGVAAGKATDSNDFLSRVGALYHDGDGAIDEGTLNTIVKNVHDAGPDQWETLKKQYADFAEQYGRKVNVARGGAIVNTATGTSSVPSPAAPPRPVNTPAGTYAPGDPNAGPNGMLPGTAPPPKAPEKLDDWQSYLAAYARDKKQPVETLSATQIADAKKTWTAAGEKASTDPSQAIAAAAAMTPRDASAPLHDEVLKGLAPAAANQVKALATGRMQFPAGAALREPYWQNMIGLVAAYDPSFDTGNYNARATARKDFTSGASAKQITSLNTVIGHIGDLADKSQALSNSSLPAYNAAKNWLKTATGSSDITNFDTVKKGVVDELTRVWRQSGGTEQDIKTWSASLNASESPDQLKGALSTIGGMLESRLSALENQRQQALGNGGDDLKVLTPASRAILDRLQGKTSGAPAAAAPRSAPADGQAGLVNGRPAVWKTNGAQGPGWYASDSGSK